MNGQIPNCSLDALFGDPTKPLDTKKYSDCQIIIIGTQECEKSLEKSLIFKSNKSWEQIIDTNFGKHFDRLKTESLMGLHMIILIRKSFRNHVHDEKSCRLATGIGNVIGNKGAVGISFMVDDTSFLFVNAHLSAHEGKTKFRNKDYNRINLNLPLTGYRQKDQQKKSISDRFDHCFFFGDLNYRIDLTRPVTSYYAMMNYYVNVVMETSLKGIKNHPFISIQHTNLIQVNLN
ncbi:Endonuclease/exonuclease/phosphatase [Globomyces pollinis-pini]|nr:Endonuclease/exonuclease/phosphatase [Globomyces pollinis-pini]